MTHAPPGTWATLTTLTGPHPIGHAYPLKVLVPHARLAPDYAAGTSAEPASLLVLIGCQLTVTNHW